MMKCLLLYFTKDILWEYETRVSHFNVSNYKVPISWIDSVWHKMYDWILRFTRTRMRSSSLSSFLLMSTRFVAWKLCVIFIAFSAKLFQLIIGPLPQRTVIMWLICDIVFSCGDCGVAIHNEGTRSQKAKIQNCAGREGDNDPLYLIRWPNWFLWDDRGLSGVICEKRKLLIWF
jgi:hypothetical protein